MSRAAQRRPMAAAELWARPEMAAALADRDLGTVVRIFRRWTGASQNDVSMLVGVPQPHVSELERGRRRVTSLDLFERFADGLGIPRHLLGLAVQLPPSDCAIDQCESRPGRSHRDTGEVGPSQAEWVRVRQALAAHRRELTRSVAALYPDAARIGDSGLLSPPEWRVRRPFDLGEVELRWCDDVPPPPIDGRHAETRPLRPLMEKGRHYDRYHRAMRDLARPRLFENRLSYRLLDVDANADRLALTLTNMCYFDMLDVGEALAHETALAALDERGGVDPERVRWERLPFRRLVRDPFALARYPLLTSVSTLTIRRSRAGSTFILLRRDPSKVAVAGGMLSVVPTGVFQPASVLPAPGSPDFDLWRNVMREYSEEFLGNPEHDGDGAPIDYAHDEPFRTLDEARRVGRIKLLCLGVGVDTLNYVGDVLTVAVFDADLFDDLFDGMVQHNDEGDFVTDDGDRRPYAFDEGTIERLLKTEPLAPSGAACLYLAWLHRASLFG